ncbi:hypothetical protein ABZ722_38515, partial [Streptomyces longwoodensis]
YDPLQDTGYTIPVYGNPGAAGYGRERNHPPRKTGWPRRPPPEVSLPSNLPHNMPYNLLYSLPSNLLYSLPPRLRPRHGKLHFTATVKGVEVRRLLLYETPQGTEDSNEEPQANDRREEAGRSEEEATEGESRRTGGAKESGTESTGGPTTASKTKRPKSARAEETEE